jgi:hypothetical protein
MRLGRPEIVAKQSNFSEPLCGWLCTSGERSLKNPGLADTVQVNGVRQSANLEITP